VPTPLPHNGPVERALWGALAPIIAHVHRDAAVALGGARGAAAAAEDPTPAGQAYFLAGGTGLDNLLGGIRLQDRRGGVPSKAITQGHGIYTDDVMRLVSFRKAGGSSWAAIVNELNDPRFKVANLKQHWNGVSRALHSGGAAVSTTGGEEERGGDEERNEERGSDGVSSGDEERSGGAASARDAYARGGGGGAGGGGAAAAAASPFCAQPSPWGPWDSEEGQRGGGGGGGGGGSPSPQDAPPPRPPRSGGGGAAAALPTAAMSTFHAQPLPRGPWDSEVRGGGGGVADPIAAVRSALQDMGIPFEDRAIGEALGTCGGHPTRAIELLLGSWDTAQVVQRGSGGSRTLRVVGGASRGGGGGGGGEEEVDGGSGGDEKGDWEGAAPRTAGQKRSFGDVGETRGHEAFLQRQDARMHPPPLPAVRTYTECDDCGHIFENEKPQTCHLCPACAESAKGRATAVERGSCGGGGGGGGRAAAAAVAAAAAGGGSGGDGVVVRRTPAAAPGGPPPPPQPAAALPQSSLLPCAPHVAVSGKRRRALVVEEEEEDFYVRPVPAPPPAAAPLSEWAADGKTWKCLKRACSQKHSHRSESCSNCFTRRPGRA
jgi:hypothetical protein